MQLVLHAYLTVLGCLFLDSFKTSEVFGKNFFIMTRKFIIDILYS